VIGQFLTTPIVDWGLAPRHDRDMHLLIYITTRSEYRIWLKKLK